MNYADIMLCGIDQYIKSHLVQPSFLFYLSSSSPIYRLSSWISSPYSISRSILSLFLLPFPIPSHPVPTCPVPSRPSLYSPIQSFPKFLSCIILSLIFPSFPFPSLLSHHLLSYLPLMNKYKYNLFSSFPNSFEAYVLI